MQEGKGAFPCRTILLVAIPAYLLYHHCLLVKTVAAKQLAEDVTYYKGVGLREA